ncbi:hypothetical protein [Paenibacillus tarimensis]|uniref:hypothetical protein n=1 Tax=Paenibacillus tarimensis TaxID=416012 RepID=UPI001F2A5207|nr:hypothetical protein [Paenibacillus tarimensis]MCF2944359.1 hypothetical protein [Paenibacillus tarimensis]
MDINIANAIPNLISKFNSRGREKETNAIDAMTTLETNKTRANDLLTRITICPSLTITNNRETTSEKGFSLTYKGTFGYAPVFAYLAQEGFGVNAQQPSSFLTSGVEL